MAARRGGTRRIAAVAAAIGATPTRVALAWLLRRSPVMIPIPGTASLSDLEENLAAERVRLPAGF
ncbi:aldo/keto reductase [Actinoplanes sp. NPDC048988]|uniref:aldo/keto reductase n=1 Tax=Actinoplanes sp. NPDC048988 TaxID=3363901 RepID=UPI003710943E